MARTQKPVEKKTTLKPFKFLVQAIVIETDGTGGIIGERPSDVVTVYGPAALREWIDNFERTLPDANVSDEPLT